MIKVGNVKARWRKNYFPTWALEAAKLMMLACHECWHERRPVTWLW